MFLGLQIFLGFGERSKKETRLKHIFGIKSQYYITWRLLTDTHDCEPTVSVEYGAIQEEQVDNPYAFEYDPIGHDLHCDWPAAS